MNKFFLPPNTSCVVLLAAAHKDNVSPTSLYYDVNVNNSDNLKKKSEKISCLTKLKAKA